MSSNRNPVFDIAKALMIFWVIWGHLSTYKVVAASDFCEPFMQNAKIALNMPLFFVISGLLAARTFANASYCKSLARAVCFLWPQFVYGILFQSCI